MSRRRLIGGAAITACVGCLGDGDDQRSVGVTRTAAPPPTDALTASAPTSAVPSAAPSVAPESGVDAGPVETVLNNAGGATYVAEARAYVVAVPEPARQTLADAFGAGTTTDIAEALTDGLAHGLLALYQRCPHLGCRVPFCESSGWFECGCHGARFTRFGEHRDGPADRGMDVFPVSVVDGRAVVLTGVVITGLPSGKIAVELPPSGAHCVGDPGTH